MHLAAFDITQLAGGVRGFRRGEECDGICDFLNRCRAPLKRNRFVELLTSGRGVGAVVFRAEPCGRLAGYGFENPAEIKSVREAGLLADLVDVQVGFQQEPGGFAHADLGDILRGAAPEEIREKAREGRHADAGGFRERGISQIPEEIRLNVSAKAFEVFRQGWLPANAAPGQRGQNQRRGGLVDCSRGRFAFFESNSFRSRARHSKVSVGKTSKMA